MKANEFLIESTLKLDDFMKSKNVKNDTTGKMEVKASKGLYWRNLLKLISSGNPVDTTKGLVQLSNPRKIYSELKAIWDGDAPATRQQYEEILKYRLKTTSGQFIPMGQITKTDIIKNVPGKKTDKNEPEKSLTKIWNIGNIIEGILGAAVTAKFKSPEKDISVKDIMKTIQSLVKAPLPKVQDKSKKANVVPMRLKTTAGGNNISFTMSLNPGDLRVLVISATNIEELSAYKSNEEIVKAYEDAATYVNTSATILTALDRIKSKGKKNEVLVESEGGSAEKQSTTKADLFITIDGKKERLLSLKAGTIPQIGQASGHAFANINEFFRSTVGLTLKPDLAKYFPVGTFGQVGQNIFDVGFKKAYQEIYKALKAAVKGDNQFAEYNLIHNVYKGIIHHATLGEDVVIVYLSPSARKAYTELKMGPDLLEALQEFDLDVELKLSETVYKIVITGIPKTPDAKAITGGKAETLLQLRSRVSDKKVIRNVVEVQSLLKTLTDIEKINERKNKKELEKAQQVTKTAPAVAAPVATAKNSKAAVPTPASNSTAPIQTIKPVGAKPKVDLKAKAKAALAGGGKKQ